MPNWVYNTINCKKEVGDKFLSKNEKGELTFSYETIIPSPATKEECPAQYINNGDRPITLPQDKPWFDWYTWNYDNWGVKWDACHCQVEDNRDGSYSIYFDSPWGAPVPVLTKLCEMFPNEIGGYFEEEGNNFPPCSWESEDGEYVETEEEYEEEEYDYLV